MKTITVKQSANDYLKLGFKEMHILTKRCSFILPELVVPCSPAAAETGHWPDCRLAERTFGSVVAVGSAESEK